MVATQRHSNTNSCYLISGVFQQRRHRRPSNGRGCSHVTAVMQCKSTEACFHVRIKKLQRRWRRPLVRTSLAGIADRRVDGTFERPCARSRKARQNETDGPAAIQQTPFRKFTDAVVVVVVAGCIRRVRLSRRRRLRCSVYYCDETLT